MCVCLQSTTQPAARMRALATAAFGLLTAVLIGLLVARQREALQTPASKAAPGRPKSSIKRLPGRRRLSSGETVDDPGAIVGGYRLDACPHGPCPDPAKAYWGAPCIGPGRKACCTTRMTNCTAFDPAQFGITSYAGVVGGNLGEGTCPFGACPNAALASRGKRCLGPLKKACCNVKMRECEALSTK